MKVPIRRLIFKSVDVYDDYVISKILEPNDFIILCLIVLYHNQKISRKQFTTYCQRYFNTNEGIQLNRRIRTCHSAFDGKWYNDVNFITLVANATQKSNLDYEISTEDILKYLNIGFSRNRNWCVNYIALSWIKPVIYKAFSYDDYLCQQLVKEFDISVDFMTLEEADRKYDLDSGYCCSDCDGCRGEYKRIRYESYYKPDKSKIFDTFRNELMKYQSHQKNPHDALINDFW